MKLLTIKLLLLGSAFLVAHSAFSSTDCLTDNTQLPPGTYQHEHKLRKERGLDVKKLHVTVSGDKVTLYHGESSLEDACHFVDIGFDIQLAEDKLVLKPGQRIKASVFISRLKLSHAESEGIWYNPLSWVPFLNWQHPALNHASDLPNTCDLKKTYLTRDSGLIETECESVNKKKVKTLMPSFEVCDANQGLVNYNGQLICRSTYAAMIQYYLGIGRLLGGYNINHLPKEHSACSSIGGSYTFIATSLHPHQINGGMHFRNSGFYLCTDKTSPSVWQDKLPKGHQFVGFDMLHNLLITRVDIKGDSAAHHLALHEPQKCLSNGLEIAGDSNSLYCSQ
ncbi:MAG: hypothetical protein ACR2PT_16220 [Endozoicomonas sp.]